MECEKNENKQKEAGLAHLKNNTEQYRYATYVDVPKVQKSEFPTLLKGDIIKGKYECGHILKCHPFDIYL